MLWKMNTPEIMRHLSSLYNFVQLKSELTPYYVEIVPAVSGGEGVWEIIPRRGGGGCFNVQTVFVL